MRLEEFIPKFASSFWTMALEASPWLALGFTLAGLIRAVLPAALISRWLGGRGIGPVVRASLLGTPLPLCSCSVLPVALGARRAGAGKGATVSFLIATPENGVDSIALSYAMLGPFMAVARIVAAIVSAVAAGLLTDLVDRTPDGSGSPAPAKSDCAKCGDSCKPEPPPESTRARSMLGRALQGVTYAFTDLWQDVMWWLLLGLVISALMNVLVPLGALAAWGHGPLAMIVMVLIGVPMYVCASASTPVAAAMIAAGVSPGTALVFLLSGPATNLGSLGIVRRELGNRATTAYLIGVSVAPILLGLATDSIANRFGVTVSEQACVGCRNLPSAVEYLAMAVLVAATLVQIVGPLTWRRSSRTRP